MVGKAKELQLELRHLGGQRTECASTDPAMLYYFKYKASCGAESWLPTVRDSHMLTRSKVFDQQLFSSSHRNLSFEIPPSPQRFLNKSLLLMRRFNSCNVPKTV